MMDDLNWNRHKSILAIDSKTLRDISGMLVREGTFKVLPDILEKIADDISSAISSEVSDS